MICHAYNGNGVEILQLFHLIVSRYGKHVSLWKLPWVELTYAGGGTEMARNRCIRSFTVSSILVSVVIVSQLFLYADKTSDDETLWRENNVLITEWDRRRMVEAFSLLCPNCSHVNVSSVNRTTDNTTLHVHETFSSYLHWNIHQLNLVQTVRNLEKFDLQADSEGALVIVVQVWVVRCSLPVLHHQVCRAGNVLSWLCSLHTMYVCM